MPVCQGFLSLSKRREAVWKGSSVVSGEREEGRGEACVNRPSAGNETVQETGDSARCGAGPAPPSSRLMKCTFPGIDTLMVQRGAA